MFMIPIPVVDIALTLITVILEIGRKSKIQDETVVLLLDRIESLEKPLQVLKLKASTTSTVYEQPLYRLVRTLEGTETVLLQYVGQPKAKRIVKILSYQDKFASLTKAVDASIADLQVALQAHQVPTNPSRCAVLSSDELSLDTAKAILSAMEASRVERMKESILELELEIDPLTPGKTKIIFDDTSSAFDICPDSGKRYALPPATKNFKEIPPVAFERDLPLPTFEQQGNIKVRIKTLKPITANPNGSSYRADNFYIEVMLISTGQLQSKGSSKEERMKILQMVADCKITVNEAERLLSAVETSISGDEPITIIDVAVDISFDDGKTWRNSNGIEVDGKQFELMKMGSRDVIKMKVIPWFDVDGKKRGWNHSAFLARDLKIPLLVRLRIEEAFGDWGSVVMAFRNPPVTDLPKKEDDDYLFVHVDDIDDLSRIYCKISRPNTRDNTFEVTGRILFSIITYTGITTTRYITPTCLRTWIHWARSTTPDIHEKGLVSLKLEDVSDSKITVIGQFDLNSGCLWGITVRVGLDEGGKEFSEDSLLEKSKDDI
ncbi:hypothetical protein HDU67_005503 [Dinochytrium kinnereticum]|nr:hypothetical protein HDU67_005503 [Dinochytrium kinnereticum]